MTRQITLEEVKKHKRKSSVWMIIHNDVYDVTSFLQEHPGGEESLVAFAGKDGTQVFEDVNHSEDARELMKKYKIGSLPPEQQHTHIATCCSHLPKVVKSKKTWRTFDGSSSRQRGYPCGGGSSYKWVLLALAGAIILGVVLKKHLAR